MIIHITLLGNTESPRYCLTYSVTYNFCARLYSLEKNKNKKQTDNNTKWIYYIFKVQNVYALRF